MLKNPKATAVGTRWKKDGYQSNGREQMLYQSSRKIEEMHQTTGRPVSAKTMVCKLLEKKMIRNKVKEHLRRIWVRGRELGLRGKRLCSTDFLDFCDKHQPRRMRSISGLCLSGLSNKFFFQVVTCSRPVTALREQRTPVGDA